MPIILKDITKKYNDTLIFDDFSFTFEEGNIYALTGTVGVGKTTLLNIISGITNIDSGTISGMNMKTISYLFQDNRLLKNKNVSENIRFVLKDTMDKSNSDKMIEEYLKLFGLYEYKNYNINELSGGMQKKLAIARTLAVPNYNLLLLDEPFNNIDVKQKNSIMENIIKIAPKDTIIIIITHNIKDIQKFTDKIYILDKIPNNKLNIKIIS